MDILCITHTVICTTYNKKKVGLENEQEKEKSKTQLCKRSNNKLFII